MFTNFTISDMNGKETIKARIKEFNGGRYGRTGEYIAIIKPAFFKNGNIKRTVFTVVEELERIKKGYAATSNARHSERIEQIIKEN